MRIRIHNTELCNTYFLQVEPEPPTWSSENTINQVQVTVLFVFSVRLNQYYCGSSILDQFGCRSESYCMLSNLFIFNYRYFVFSLKIPLKNQENNDTKTFCPFFLFFAFGFFSYNFYLAFFLSYLRGSETVFGLRIQIHKVAEYLRIQHRLKTVTLQTVLDKVKLPLN